MDQCSIDYLIYLPLIVCIQVTVKIVYGFEFRSLAPRLSVVSYYKYKWVR